MPSKSKVMLSERRPTLESLAIATQCWGGNMAKAVGVKKGTILRVWLANGLQPHAIKTFTVAAQFTEKLLDVVEFNVNSSKHALGLPCNLTLTSRTRQVSLQMVSI